MIKIDIDNTGVGERLANGINEVQEKARRISEYRAEASRLSSMANKRIARLEKNNLQDSPAYKKYLESGGKFGVKGKSYNEVQKEVARLKRFIDSSTSTVRGTTKTLKEMAENTGIKYKNLEDLKSKSKNFFELASKVEQYLRNVEDMASAIGYQQIWEAINEYSKESLEDLETGEVSIDSMVESVTNALKDYEEPTPILGGWYTLKNHSK